MVFLYESSCATDTFLIFQNMRNVEKSHTQVHTKVHILEQKNRPEGGRRYLVCYYIIYYIYICVTCRNTFIYIECSAIIKSINFCLFFIISIAKYLSKDFTKKLSKKPRIIRPLQVFRATLVGMINA